MAVVRLTETAINRALRQAEEDGTRRDLSDPDERGLRLRVAPGGGTWVLAARDREGRMRRFRLGAWPALKLSEAREAARALRERVKAGADPIADARRTRATARAAKDGVGTLAALLTAYGAKQGAALKSWPEADRRIRHVFQKALERPLAHLAARDLQFIADAHPAAQSAAAATRYLRPVLRWAASRDLAPAALAAIEPPAKVKARARVLAQRELRAVLAACEGSPDPFRRAVVLLLLTATRRSEALEARWRDVDLGARTWRLPETKNGLEHVVPLSQQAAELLAAWKPADSNPDALIFATKGDRPLGNIDRALKRLHEDTGTTGWRLHDLRRTAATTMGELGVDPHVIEAALNHTAVVSRLASTYNAARYRPQVAAALQLLADRLDGIREGGAQIVPLRA